MDHNHFECEHEVAYCKKCQVVYCKKCGKEWRDTWNPWKGTTYPTWPQTTPTYPWYCQGAITTSSHTCEAK